MSQSEDGAGLTARSHAPLATPGVLHPGWYCEVVVQSVDPALPGIYEWRIEGSGCYIGQYTHVRRPRREYGLNVGRILTRRPYRTGKPGGFRGIHIQLADAVKAGHCITLTLLENQPMKADRNRRERELIAQRRAEAEAGGLPVLNSEPPKARRLQKPRQAKVA